MQILPLYKQILRASQTFPSKNRLKITRSIIEEFQANKSLVPGTAKYEEACKIAVEGLQTLRGYDFEGVNWTLETSKNPLGAPAKKE